MYKPKLLLLQLPIPQPSRFAASGNVPLAAGYLGVAVQVSGLLEFFDLQVVPPMITDLYGDQALVRYVLEQNPTILGFSLYLWNVERSLYLAREIKKHCPQLLILIGGPEVSADNPFVLNQTGFDIAVTGEAEETFTQLLFAIHQKKEIRTLSGIAVREPSGQLTSFTPAPPPTFSLTRFPSPYLNQMLPVEPHRSVYVETVRGCKSHCTFCFYPRSSSSLRSIDVAESSQLLETLKNSGAKEIVFLDPTFNHRPELVPLLESITRLNADRQLSFFAEVRAEGITSEIAQQFAQAGFHKLEIGLQSVNPKTLAYTKRGGNPEKVAQVANLFQSLGIRLLVDLILGLPGDTREDIKKGIDFLQKYQLASEAQIFFLSVLPGTAMRQEAEKDGLIFDPNPPYRIIRTKNLEEEELREAFFEAEETLDRRLDESPRPFLADPDPTLMTPDFFSVCVEDWNAETSQALTKAGANHSALWIMGKELFSQRDNIRKAIEIRLQQDPYGILDVVLYPEQPFPLNLIDFLKQQLELAVPSYLSRTLAHRGENAQRRLTVVLPQQAKFPKDYLATLASDVFLFQNQTFQQALKNASLLGETLPGARIINTEISWNASEWEQLKRNADPEMVVFASRVYEQKWLQEVLEYREF